MQMTVTAKIQLIVPSEYYELLINTANTYRNACNFVSEYVYNSKHIKNTSKKHL